MTRIARWATTAAAVAAALGSFAAPAYADVIQPGSPGGPTREVLTAGCASGEDAATVAPTVVDADSAASFYRCDPVTHRVATRDGHATCVPGGLFDWSRGLCEPAATVPEMATRLTAGKATLSTKPLKVVGLHATLVRARAAGPQDAVWNATITFKDTTGKVLCVARTDVAGQASCDADRPRSGAEVLSGGYTAEYAGNGAVNGGYDTVAPATAQGGIRAVLPPRG
ncbi:MULTISPECIES: hypothetical protein [Streptomyces]|uniref:Chitin-binding type-2 domain-containing protein n=2 Tax=Streptomyces TaxID=1883 RepID=A0A2N8PBE8_STRNR|nr:MULTISPECIES: hypothetical protein [Streptomyces]PNE38333.1 hypothetical protein AOB60_30200 [Streptomyces noursei]SHN28842.1 hypothetical protein SAMN05216268_1307 [Streptomyces yunnanensis]